MNNGLYSRSCPALMADARFGTDYRPSCDVYTTISRQNKIMNSAQMREFLQSHAVELMQMNTQHLHKQKGCNKQWVAPDPNGQDTYWQSYRKYMGL